jgi:hypothetical protein
MVYSAQHFNSFRDGENCLQLDNDSFRDGTDPSIPLGYRRPALHCFIQPIDKAALPLLLIQEHCCYYFSVLSFVWHTSLQSDRKIDPFPKNESHHDAK